jgi:Ca-activated chloride channel family protein
MAEVAPHFFRRTGSQKIRLAEPMGMSSDAPAACPSNLTLERYELGELAPAQLTALHAHVRQCERCRERIEAMDSQGASYRRTLSALNTRNALHKADARWWSRARMLVAAPVLAGAVAALVLLLSPHAGRLRAGPSQPRVQARALPPGARVVEPRRAAPPLQRMHFVNLRGERVEFGQGSLEAAPENGRARPFVLRHTEVEAEISGFVSDVTVTQEFENPFSERVEALYVFPLPDDSAVHEMVLEVGGRKVRGVIQRREEARRTYEQARAEGRHAALLDQERPNIFTQSVANILPGERVKVSLRYVAQLAYDDGTFEFNFPMVVGPRYMPGQRLDGEPQGSGTSPDTSQVVDASRISPPSAVLDRSGRDVRITVRLHAGMEVEQLDSVSHQLWVDQRSAREAMVWLAENDRIPNRDFILRYRPSGRQPQGAVMATGGRDGYFALMLQPGAHPPAKDEVMPRDLVFVLDTSGSMNGQPLAAVKRAVRRAFQSMSAEDRFMLINFADTASSFRDELLPATRENLERAEQYLNALPARGGTHQMAGIHRALTLPPEEGRLRAVLLMTDGYIGNEAEIFARTEPLIGSSRLFGFGVGNSVNHFFLDRLSRLGRGFYQSIRTDEDPSEAVERFIRRIEKPVLTGVVVDWGGLEVWDVHPERMPDLFHNQPLVVLGRYRQPGSATVRVRGRTPRGEYVTEVPVSLPAEGGHSHALRTLWARARIEELDRERARNPDPTLAERIAVLGLEYKLVTAFTSFVAVDEVGPVATEGSEQRGVEPTAQPQGTSPVVSVPDGSSGEAKALRALSKRSDRLSGLVGKAPVANEGLGTFGLGGGNNKGGDTSGAVLLRGKGGGDVGKTRIGGVVTRVTARNISASQGTIDREQVARVFNSHAQQVQACYERALLKQPSLAGKLVIEFTLSPKGKVAAAKVKHSTLLNAALEACVLGVLKTWTFPPHNGSTVVVTYPFLFNPVEY